MTLNDLTSGQKARIIKIDGESNMRRRLMTMGIISGNNINMIKAAPLRDPLELSVNNSHISLRRQEASFIHVELIEHE